MPIHPPSSDGSAPIHLLPGAGRTFDVLGNRFTILIAGRHTGDAYTVCHVTLAAGNMPPGMHAHDALETILVISGSLHLQTAGSLTPRLVQAGAGSLLHIPRRTPHAFYNPGPAPAHLLVVSAPAGVEQFIAELGAMPGQLPPDLARIIAIHHKHNIIFYPHSKEIE